MTPRPIDVAGELSRETGWGADGLHGTWEFEPGGGGARWGRHAPEPEPLVPADAPWAALAVIAVGWMARGAWWTVRDVALWACDAQAAKVCDAALRHERYEAWFRADAIRSRHRASRFLIVAGALGGAPGVAWLVARHTTVAQCYALVATLAVALCAGAFFRGRGPVVTEPGRDGELRLPAELDLPTAPPAHLRPTREPTGTEVVRAVRAVFHPGETKLRTQELVDRLARGGDPWTRFDAQSLGRRLGDLGLKSIEVPWTDAKTGKRHKPKGFTVASIDEWLDQQAQ